MLAMIALGGAIGSVTRYLLGGAVQKLAGMSFPLGTLVVNVSGSFAAGFLLRYFMSTQSHPMLRAALLAGFCGGFTTFSAFSTDTLGMIEGGEYGRASLYVVTSVALSLAAVFAGFAAGSMAIPHHSR